MIFQVKMILPIKLPDWGIKTVRGYIEKVMNENEARGFKEDGKWHIEPDQIIYTTENEARAEAIQENMRKFFGNDDDVQILRY